MHLRPLRPEDLPLVQALVRRTAQEVYGHLWTEAPASLSATDWTEAWVATRHDIVVGVALTSASDLEDLWVDRAARDQGIGSALLARCESQILHHGYPEAQLRVISTNTQAIAFYTRHGWRPREEHPHETLPTSVTRMTKDLLLNEPQEALESPETFNSAEPIPVVPIPQDPFLPKRRLQRLVNALHGAQFVRYIGVGLFNTVFGYGTFAFTLFLLTHAVPQRFLYLTVIAASLISTPLNITVAYFGYKFLVFKTRGNYLLEWFKCFGVYGVGMLPGLFALSAVTRLLQSLTHSHAPALHNGVNTLASHLNGAPLAALHRLSSGHALAGYLAGALVQGFTTIFSFVGHKKVTFKTPATPAS